jgi:hypothetical protein
MIESINSGGSRLGSLCVGGETEFIVRARYSQVCYETRNKRDVVVVTVMRLEDSC